jgi:hypothetical protein
MCLSTKVYAFAIPSGIRQMRNPWWVANASSCRESTIKRESTINAILTFGSDWFCQIWMVEPNVVLETVRRHLARSLPLLGSEPGRLVGRSPSGSFNWPSIPLSSHLVSPFPLCAPLGISSLVSPSVPRLSSMPSCACYFPFLPCLPSWSSSEHTFRSHPPTCALPSLCLFLTSLPICALPPIPGPLCTPLKGRSYTMVY